MYALPSVLKYLAKGAENINNDFALVSFPPRLTLFHCLIFAIEKNIDNQAPYVGFSDAKCNKVPANCYVCCFSLNNYTNLTRSTLHV